MVPVLTLLVLCHKVTRGGIDACMDNTLNQCISSFFLWVIFKTSFPLLFSSNQAARWKNGTASSQLRDATHAMHGQYGSILIVAMDTSLLPQLEKLAYTHAWMKSSRNAFCTRVCMHNQSLCTLTHICLAYVLNQEDPLWSVDHFTVAFVTFSDSNPIIILAVCYFNTLWKPY